MRVTIPVPPDADNGQLYYQAAAPSDFRLAFAGSGLPFPSLRAAMENTPNKGTITAAAPHVVLQYPNSYRDGENGVVGPSIHVAWQTNGEWKRRVISIGPRVPHRSLTYQPQRVALGAMFYDGTHELEVRGQEQVLRESAYPSKHAMPRDTWGTRPRL